MSPDRRGPKNLHQNFRHSIFSNNQEIYVSIILVTQTDGQVIGRTHGWIDEIRWTEERVDPIE